MYNIRIGGHLPIVSYHHNLFYLCDCCLKWFNYSVIVRIYSYPDDVLLATVSNGRVIVHEKGGAFD